MVRNGKSTAGHQRYLCSHCRKTWQLQFTYTASQPGTHQKIIDMAMNGVGCRATARIMGVGLNTIFRHTKNCVVSVTRAYSRAVTSSSARKWTNSGDVGAKSRQRWLFYAYDRLRKTVVAHVFGERTMATLGRLMSLLSPFDVVIWMTDGWPLYESRLKGKLHVISKRYTQRIERHNLNLRQHLARLGRKSLSFSKSVELHDKVIGHYLNIKHYQ
uniref:IS1 family transposase n=1 Tax=Escherichia coli TaxID=562 RepID=UPI00350E43D1